MVDYGGPTISRQRYCNFVVLQIMMTMMGLELAA
jgi:hypothetical protein